MKQYIKQYEIWQAELPVLPNSHIQNGFRPVIIVSNNKANTHSPVVTIVPLTSRPKANLPTHVLLEGQGLRLASLALCEQVSAVDRGCLKRKIGAVENAGDVNSLHRALAVQLGMAA